MRGVRGISKSRLVSIIIPANNTASQIAFPDQPDLRYARILGMETFTASDLATDMNGVANLPDANLNGVMLVLETNDADQLFENEANSADNPNNNGRFRTTAQNIKWIPLTTLHRVQNATPAPFVRELLEFGNIFISWDKCYLNMPVPINPGGSPICVTLNVYYTFRSIYGKLITRT